MDLSDVRARLRAVDSEYANRLDRDDPWTILDAVMAAVRDLRSDVTASIVMADRQQREREEFAQGVLTATDPAFCPVDYDPCPICHHIHNDDVSCEDVELALRRGESVIDPCWARVTI